MAAKLVSLKGWMVVAAVVLSVAAWGAAAEPGRGDGADGGPEDGPPPGFGPGGHGPGHGPCAADAERLCAGIEPGGGRVRDCMRDKASEASAECQAHIARGEERHAKMEAFRTTCGPELERVCGVSLPEPGAGPGGHGKGKGKGAHQEVKACVDAHAAELSPACQAMIEEQKAEHAQRKAQHQAVKDACQADVQTFCADTLADAEGAGAGKGKGKGRGKRHAVGECLKAHERQLSGECSAAIQAARP